MAERGRPALDGPGGSPVPEGYGSLNEAAPGTGAPARPRRPGRRSPEARSTVAAEARQAESRSAGNGTIEDDQLADPRPTNGAGNKQRARRGTDSRAAAEARAAAEILAGQQAEEARLSGRSASENPAPVSAAVPAAGPVAGPLTLPAEADPVVAAGPAVPATRTAARASDAQAAEQWAAQRREAVQESRRAASGPAGRGGFAEPDTLAVPLAGGPAGPGVPSPAAARRELWEEDDEGAGRSRRRQRVRVVRSTSSRRLVRRIDTWTVFKVSFVFYLLTLIILIVAGIILWNVAEAFGTITSIEKSARSLFSLSHFVLKPTPLLEYTTAGGAVLCAFGTLVNTVAAMLYNLISDVVGGVQVVVVSEPD